MNLFAALSLLFLVLSCGSPTLTPVTSVTKTIPPLPRTPNPLETPDTTRTSAAFGTVRSLSPDPQLSLTGAAGWERDAVFYHIWVKSFYDTDSDGIGDLDGVTAKLDYLKELGVSALWLSPIFRTAGESNPQGNMHGYDVTDYYEINPWLGTKDDLRDLLMQAHAKGLRVIFDFVPNHTSSQHPWFLDSRLSLNGKRDWYVWSQSQPSGWLSTGGGNPWYSASGSYYYGIFWSGMPDLNYKNPSVVSAMVDIVTYWLNFGFDGMRVDAVKYLHENGPGSSQDQTDTYLFYDNLRSEVFDAFDAAGYGKFMVAENWTSSTANLYSYGLNNGRAGFHMTLDFPLAYDIASAANNATPALIADHYDQLYTPRPAGFGFGAFLSNHDQVLSRPMSYFTRNLPRVRMSAALMILGPETPFLYYGNEVGMEGNASQDINLRSPMSWGDTNPDNPVLMAYKDLLKVRSSYDAFAGAAVKIIKKDAGALAYVLSKASTGKKVLVVFHWGAGTADLVLDLSTAGLSSNDFRALYAPGADGSSLSGGCFTVAGMSPWSVRVYALDEGGQPLAVTGGLFASTAAAR